ncbi:MAG: hypothetical protein RIS44_160 [Pseudomonadota bacterium]
MDYSETDYSIPMCLFPSITPVTKPSKLGWALCAARRVNHKQRWQRNWVLVSRLFPRSNAARRTWTPWFLLTGAGLAVSNLERSWNGWLPSDFQLGGAAFQAKPFTRAWFLKHHTKKIRLPAPQPPLRAVFVSRCQRPPNRHTLCLHHRHPMRSQQHRLARSQKMVSVIAGLGHPKCTAFQV